MEFPSVVLIIIAVLVIRGSVAEKSERRDMAFTPDSPTLEAAVNRSTSVTGCFFYTPGSLEREMKIKFQDKKDPVYILPTGLQMEGIDCAYISDTCMKCQIIAKKKYDGLRLTFSLLTNTSPTGGWTEEVVSKSISLEIMETSTNSGSGSGSEGSTDSPDPGENGLSTQIAAAIGVCIPVLLGVIVIGIVLTVIAVIAVRKNRCSQSQGKRANGECDGLKQANAEDSVLDLDVETDSPRKTSKDTASTRGQSNLFHRKVRQ